MTRTVSPAGRAALMTREGCRLTAYRDGVGVPTIGVGHTGRTGPPPVALGMTITQAEAEAIFAADLAPFEAAVNDAMTRDLTQNQFDALVSLAFNIGVRGFAGSTVVHRLRVGDDAGAADAFLMWVHPPELAQRRRTERAQFLRPDQPTPPGSRTAPAPRPAALAATPRLAGPISCRPRRRASGPGSPQCSHERPPDMPAILLSLLPLIGRLAPDLLGLAFGTGTRAEGIESVAAKVEAAVRDIFGTADPAAIEAQAAADPAKTEALKARLTADTAALEAQLADVADARSATLDLARAASPLAWGSPVISAIVVAAFATVSVVVFARYGVESAVGQLIAGALISKFGTVVDYWLGSSKGSSDRADQITAMLHQAIGSPGSAPAGQRGRS